MKIIKPVLLGPKLIAVGPLKCFKGGGSSGGGGGGGSSSGGGKGGGGGSGSGGSSGGDKGGSGSSGGGETPQQRESRLKKEEMDKKAAEQKRRDEQAAKERDDRQKAVREREIKRQAEIKKQQEAEAKREKILRDKTKREQESTEQASGFFDKLGTGLKGLSYGKFTTNKREVEQEEKSYNRARKTQGINEARRLGRPVAVDGLVYKPGMQTPEEAEQASVAAAEEEQRVREETSPFGRQVKQIQQEEAAQKAEEQQQKQFAQELERKKQLAAGKGYDSVEQMEAVEGRRQRIDDIVQKKAEIDYSSGAISADEYEERTGFAPGKELRDKIGVKRNLPKALSGVLGLTKFKAAAPAVEQIAKFGQRKLTPEATEDEAMEAISQEDIAASQPTPAPVDPKDEQPMTVQEAQKDPSLRPFVPRTGESKSTPAPAAPAPVVAAAPAPKPEPKPVEQLTPDEVGESIVKKEAKMIRERTLAQQLAQIRGLRGVSPGQKARLLQRSQERFDREFAPQVQIAMMKERETRRKEQLGLSEAEKNRKNLLEQARLKKGVSSGGGASQPGWLSGLNAVATALPKIDAVTTGLGKFLGAEGGFVSGPGTETSDSIPARLSDGEFVIKASAVRGIGKSMGAKGKEEQRKKGVDFLYKVQDKMGKKAEGGEIKPDFDRFLKFMDKGVSHGLMKKRIEKARISKKEKEKLLKGLGKEPKFAKGGEAYARPKKAFKEATGYEPESRFHDKAAKDAKHGGARRKFRHFQDGGSVDMKGPGVVKDQFKMPSSGYGAVVSAQGDLMRRIEELERKVGK